MTRHAFLDIGTNTALLLVVEIQKDGSVKVLHDQAQIPRLGQGLNQGEMFLKESMDRAISVLKDYKAICENLKCETVTLYGTAASRRAKNRQVLMDRIADEIEWTLQVISGEKEAELISLATLSDFASLPNPKVILDIGGGSTEFIVSEDGVSQSQLVSLLMGVVRFKEAYLKGFPAKPEELLALDAAIQDRLKDLPKGFLVDVKTFIATAGTPTTVSALMQSLPEYDSEKVHGSEFSIQELETLMARLEAMSLEELESLPCLPKGRADMIVAGCRILKQVLLHFGVGKVHVSDKGLRYGMLAEFLSVKS